MMINICIITGATATGKSDIAVQIARKLDGVVINCDSRQVYKEVPIITAQPTDEDMQGVVHKLYGYKSIFSHHSVSYWYDDLIEVIEKLDGRIPVITGGTGMYISVIENGFLDTPKMSDEVKNEVMWIISEKGVNYAYNFLLKKGDEYVTGIQSCNDKYRITRAMECFLQSGQPFRHFYGSERQSSLFQRGYKIKKLIVEKEREDVYRNINTRFDVMVEQGVIDEIASVHEIAKRSGKSYPKIVGAQPLIQYIEGKMSLPDAISKGKQDVRRYAKRQMTWFRNQESGALRIVDSDVEKLCMRNNLFI